MKTLSELQAECATLGIRVPAKGRSSREGIVVALREYRWRKDHLDEPLPAQIMPMLLGNWDDLDKNHAAHIEQEGSGWIVQPKLDGVRALLHIEQGRVRITSRCVSEVTYRLGEFQDNIPHLTVGLSKLAGTILDGELLCPVRELNTGTSIAAHPLQAAVAILATSPGNAHNIQERQNAHLRLHVFDVLRFRGTEVASQSLGKRLDLVHQAVADASNNHLEIVRSFAIGKAAIHHQIIVEGGEGTVWKKLDQPYEPGRRVRHWIKRKRRIEVEAFVTGFKPGTPQRGHAHLVGAVQFGVRQEDGTTCPIAWVSAWTDAERQAMTQCNAVGSVHLKPSIVGRRALLTGQDYSAKSKRIQHARMIGWLDR